MMRLARLLALAALAGCMTSEPGPSDPPTGQSATALDGCYIGGCSRELCADSPEISSCIWEPQYACYNAAICERQVSGTCGWTPTPELAACLSNPPSP